MKSFLFLWIGLACAITPLHADLSQTTTAESAVAKFTTRSESNQILAHAFRTGRSDFNIRCEGRVIRLLGDDTEGIRHQRFLMRLSTGQTLLIVHNIDLAPRIKKLQIRDRVVVKGEYIWNDLGGLIHYTHRDPDGEGFHGFIRHKQQLYR